jgi:hypothetical protein
MSHIRKVSTGMSGSSMFETEARTSGYGLSSSWRVSKSNFILQKEDLVWDEDREDLWTHFIDALSSSGSIVDKSDSAVEGCRFSWNRALRCL